MYTPSDEINIAVIGGGAAGMMAAGTALSLGALVTVFESTDRLGKKLAITGKGRCNVTNDSDISVILQNIPRNPRFMYAPLSAFSPEDTNKVFFTLSDSQVASLSSSLHSSLNKTLFHSLNISTLFLNFQE